MRAIPPTRAASLGFSRSPGPAGSSATSDVSRRGFLHGALAATGAAVAATCGAHPLAAGAPRTQNQRPSMKLSLAAYSFSRILPRNKTLAEMEEAPMTLIDFVDYCAELDLDACEPTGYYFPSDVDNDYLLDIKNRAFRLGLDISGTAIGNNFCLPEGPERDAQLQMTRDWIDHSAVMGAPVIRIFAGNVPRGDSEEAAVERCIAGINESLEYAAQKGVFLALENHGGITATPDQMFRIVEGVKDSPWFGVNFDSGNFHTDDPYRDLARIAPYAINAQVKTEISYSDGPKQPADLKRIVQILREANYRGYVVLEYEAKEEPKEAIPRYINELRALIHG